MSPVPIALQQFAGILGGDMLEDNRRRFSDREQLGELGGVGDRAARPTPGPTPRPGHYQGENRGWQEGYQDPAEGRRRWWPTGAIHGDGLEEPAPKDAEDAASFPHCSASYAGGVACRRVGDVGPTTWWEWKPPAALETLFERWGRGLADGGETWAGGRWAVGGWGVVVVRPCDGEGAVHVWRGVWEKEKGEGGGPGSCWVGQAQALQWFGVSSPSAAPIGSTRSTIGGRQIIITLGSPADARAPRGL